eukprot:6019018-Amphidinium_carterae.1
MVVINLRMEGVLAERQRLLVPHQQQWKQIQKSGGGVDARMRGRPKERCMPWISRGHRNPSASERSLVQCLGHYSGLLHRTFFCSAPPLMEEHKT